MAPKPELSKLAHVGIIERALSQNLKRLGCRTSRVGHEPVHDFESVLVGLMLVVPGDPVADGVCQKQQGGKQQEEQRERSPVAECADLPAFAISPDQTIREPIAGIVEAEQQNEVNAQHFRYVSKDVVYHFVAEYEHRLRRVQMLHRRCPYDGTLG